MYNFESIIESSTSFQRSKRRYKGKCKVQPAYEWTQRFYFPTSPIEVDPTFDFAYGQFIAKDFENDADPLYRHEKDQSWSPLLALPPEIRNLIYESAFGSKVVHISVRNCNRKDRGAWSYHSYYRSDPDKLKATSVHDYLRLTHSVCVLPSDEEDRIYERSFPRMDLKPLTGSTFEDLQRRKTNFTTVDEDNSVDLADYSERHKRCYAALLKLKYNWYREDGHVYASPMFNNCPDSGGLPVALLRTCRQIYREASTMIYANNTFAFHEGYTLELFMGALSPHRRKLLQSIQADGWLTSCEELWAVNRRVANLLDSVRRLHVCVSGIGTRGGFGNPFGVRTFSLVRLENVQVIVLPRRGEAGSRPADRKEAEKIEQEISDQKYREN